MRRLPYIVAALCLLAILVSIDVSFRDGTFVINLKWYHVLLLVPPLFLMMRNSARRFDARQREERRHAGLCSECAYDLRATPQRCPECGRRAEGPSPSHPITPD